MMAQRFDVIIVGAGAAGAGLAAALGGGALRVALLEAQPLRLTWPTLGNGVNGFDTRVSALTGASQNWLEQLGAWQLICDQRLCAYTDMHVWDGDGTGSIHFDAASVNRKDLGHIVENGILQTALLQRVSSHHNIQVFSPVRIQGYRRDTEQMSVDLEDGRSLAAPLLVAADGANSSLREWAGFNLREWDYGHTAIAATVATALPHARTAWQVFQPEGPIALLPLAGGGLDQHYCSLVWSTQPEHASALLELDDAGFAKALGAAFEQRLGAIEAVGPRLSFPLRARHASAYVQPGLALIGDAAHTIHPLAGQGINLGLLDAQALAGELLRASQRGLGPADPSALARYQRRRKGDNLATLAAMEGFKRLFGARPLPLRWLRNSGMNVLDQSALLKRLLIRQALGSAA